MTLTLRDVLAMPVLTRARPQVIVGSDRMDQPVRWVHTSEIYEIAPLLKGREVLLTTGLGLIGADEHAQRVYVDGIADRDVAALMLELGRTFSAAPAPLVEAAARRGLPLVVFHSVVPFVEVTESVHEVLLAEELGRLRRRQEISSSFTRRLLAGASLGDLVRQVSVAANAPAALVATDERVVVSAGGLIAWSAEECSEPVLHGSGEWGRLVLQTPATDELRLLLECAAGAVALALVRGPSSVTGTRATGRAFLADLVDNRFASAEEITERAAVIGFVPNPGRHLLAIALSATPDTSPRVAETAVVTAARSRLLQPTVGGSVNGEVLVVSAVPKLDGEALRSLLHDFVDDVGRALADTGGGRVLACAAGHVVDSVPALVRSLTAAQQARRLAQHLGLGADGLLAGDVGVYRLLGRLLEDPELERFVTEQLGALLDHDAATGSGLVMTLDAWFQAGRSKTAAADLLGVRRQTMYARLQRIERLVGGRLDDPTRLAALELAMLAWKTRRAGQPPVR